MSTVAPSLSTSGYNFDTPENLLAALSTSAHSFLQPSSTLHTSAILAAKRLLDPLAFDVGQTQEERRKEKGKKRKRSEVQLDGSDQGLQLREVYTDGFGISQIWEQARRVLDAASNEVERDLENSATSRLNGLSAVTTEEPNVRMMQFDKEGFEIGFGEGSDLADEDEAEDLEDQDEDIAAHDDESEEEDVEDVEYAEDDLGDSSSEEEMKTFQPDPNALNDGFFSIDDFNKQSQFLEQKDARGEDDNPSDEDEIDWGADPLTMSFSRPKPGKNQDETSGPDEDEDDDEDDGEGDEEGATFGNADLSAPFSEGEEGDEVEDGDLGNGMGGLDNTNDIRYADFFEPPPKRPSKTKRMRALPKTQPPSKPTKNGAEDVENDIERAISDVRRDLLESEDEDEKDDLSYASSSGSGNPTGKRLSKEATAVSKMSTHEKQRAAIAAEIRRLEAANASKRDWTLSGEARAIDRPLNSLIEEDLEFERVGKPVPVITADVSEEIESLIKRRILARDFDEVIRRRPDAVNSAADARRGRAAIELDDAKPQQGLAEVYEQEHLKRTDPGYVDKRSTAEKKAQENITRLMREAFRDLDLLTNNHLRPKKPEIEVQVVGDKPTISMEDARPGAGADGVGEESMLAPQEIYRPGEEHQKGSGEVLRKSGAAVSKEEMTREEKLRRRRREKERGKKSKGNVAAQQVQQQLRSGDKPDGRGTKGKGQGKRDIISELKRGGVQVIGKKGNLEDLGKKANKENNRRALESGGALKL
jgi:U3 small nucleolar RNA-associated protein MPP10